MSGCGRELAAGQRQPCDVVRAECREGTFYALIVRTALLKAIPCPMTVDGGARSDSPLIFDGKHIENSIVKAYDAERIDFRLDAPLDLMVEGEVITMTPVRLDVLRHAVEVRV